MKKTEYLKPTVRVKPVVTEGALMEFSVHTNTTVEDGLAKETDWDTDEFQIPKSNSVWDE